MRAVFLDRDGTIAQYVEYCRHPEAFQLLPGVGAAIRKLNRADFLVVVVTNQSAVGRGWLTVERLAQIHEKMRRELRRFGARVDGVYVCPHHPDDGCACRKPKAGLFEQAAQELRVSLADSYVVGDRPLDVCAGRAAGSATILVRSGHEPESLEGVTPDHEAVTLVEAVDWILQQERVKRPSKVRRRAAAVL